MQNLIKQLYNSFNELPKISTDSRNISEGSIYISLKGENFDGNKFAYEAIEKGAVLAVVDDKKIANSDKIIKVENSLQFLQELSSYHRDLLGLHIISITGTNGKTTTKELIKTVLSKKYKTFATKGNLNNHIGVPITLLSIIEDTELAIVEMGANHIGEIGDLCKIAKPNFGLITNIGKAHLEGFGSFNGVIKTKTELYKYIDANNGICFVNSDDKLLMENKPSGTKIYYGKRSNNSFTFLPDSNLDFLRVKYTFDNNNTGTIKTNLFGKYNFYNILAAIEVGLFFNIPFTEIVSALEEFIPTMARSQWINSRKNKIILDAYNANPSSMTTAIQSFYELKKENKILILGDMFELGTESAAEHQKISDFIQSLKFENVILVGDQFSGTKNNFLRLSNSSELKQLLRKAKYRNNTIMLKGSRGMKLEEMIEVL